MPMPITVVTATTRHMTPHNLQLNSFMQSCLQIILRIHRIWYWCQRIEVYTNPDNFLKLAAGHSVNWIAGHKSPVRLAAWSVLIAARMTENAKTQIELVLKGEKFWEELTDPHPLNRKIKRSSLPKNRWISPSVTYRGAVLFYKYKNKIIKITKIIFELIVGLFILSMKIMDSVAAFSYGEDIRNESINELFVNSSKCLEELIKNKEFLLSCLKNGSKTIGEVLTGSNSIFTVEQLIEVVEKGINATEKVHNGIEAASKKTGVVVTDLFKRGLFGIFQSAGLTDLLPDSWVPFPKSIRFKSFRRKKVRFPPENIVTRFINFDDFIASKVNIIIKKHGTNLAGKKTIHYEQVRKKLTFDILDHYSKLCERFNKDPDS